MLRVLALSAVVAVASAGFDANFMNMMMQVMQNHNNNNQSNNTVVTPQQPAVSGGCASGNCQVPAGVDVGAYLQQQKQQQSFQQQQMAAKIKAQFDSIMSKVTERKHRYAMGVMTEFATMCGCMETGLQTYQTMFVQNAKALNMTDVYDWNAKLTMKPYEAATLKDAKEIMFGSLVKALCEKIGTYMTFAEQVEQQIAILNQRPAVGK